MVDNNQCNNYAPILSFYVVIVVWFLQCKIKNIIFKHISIVLTVEFEKNNLDHSFSSVKHTSYINNGDIIIEIKPLF